MNSRSLVAGRGPVLGLLVLLVALSALFWPSVTSLMGHWTEPHGPGSHGFLLLAALGYLIRGRWLADGRPWDPRPRAAALVLLLLLSPVWMLAGLAYVALLRDLSFVLMTLPLAWLLTGYRSGTRMGWPLLLLATTIPVWELFYPVHREVTTELASRLTDLIGIPTFRDGFSISVPAGDFAVDRACSGIAQLTSAVAVLGLYAYLERLTLLGSLLLAVLGWLLVFASNAVRVAIIVVAGQTTGMEHPLVHDHGWLGWVVFGIGIVVLLGLVGKRLPRTGVAPTKPGPMVEAAASASHVSGRPFVSIAATLIAVSIGPTLMAFAASAPAPTAVAIEPLPEHLGRWSSTGKQPADWQPYFVGADVEQGTRYRGPAGNAVDLFVARYLEQRQGKEAVFYANRVFREENWRGLTEPRRQRVDLEPSAWHVEETVLKDAGGRERLVWRWYRVGGRVFGSGVGAKLASIVAALRGDRSAEVVVASSPKDASLAEVRDRLADFMARLEAVSARRVAMGHGGLGS